VVMKVILLVLLVTLALAAKRRIEILPSRFSPPDFSKKIIEVDEEYIQQNLVGRRDLTFVDITDGDAPTTDNSISDWVKAINYPAPRRQQLLKPLLEKITANTTRALMTKLTSFPHRHSSRQGSQASIDMIKSELERIINKLPEIRKKRFTIALVPIPRFVAPSIIVNMEGSGSDKDTHVCFGAHADDVGHPNAGADDNGSGSTCAFESFRAIAESSHDPSKTITWFFYTAEESGLVGSTHIVREWKAAGKKVYGHVNFDMAGYHPTGQPLAGRRLTINTTPKITEYTFVLSKEYTKLDINTWAFNGGSDHIPWTRNGYESACLSERVFSPNYHTSRDQIGSINFDLVTEFAKLAASWLVEAS